MKAERQSDVSCVPHGELLRRMAEELSAVRWMALDIQETTSRLVDEAKPDVAMMRDLQKVDVLTQMIDDLANVTRWLSGLDNFEDHSPEMIAQTIRLSELVARIARGLTTEPDESDQFGNVALF